MLLVKLFVTFFKIGLFSFGGGYGMLSVIQGEVVTRYSCLTMSEFTDIVAISQMTPGPIGINSATYVGSALFTYGIAALSEGFGWELTIGIWVLIAALGALICLTIARPFVKSVHTDTKESKDPA